MEDKISKARELQGQGRSVRDIAESLKVSKSTVGRWLKPSVPAAVAKSWLSPTWTTLQGGEQGPVDAYGAVSEPTPEELTRCYEDTVYACSKWLSDNVSSVPLKVYVTTDQHQQQPKCLTAPVLKSAANLEHLPGVDVREVLRHPFKELVDRPNEQQNRNELLRLIDIDLSLSGNSFLLKRRAKDGATSALYPELGLPTAVYPLDAQHITLAMDEHDRLLGFFDNRKTTPIFLPKEDVIWFKFVDPRNRHGLGYSPTRGVYERVLLAKQELAYLASLYRNQSRPDSIVNVKGIVADQAERMQKELNMRFRQGGQHGVWVVDSDEMDIKPLGWNPKDVLGTELYRWTKLQILNAFGLNPGLFDTESSNRAVADTALYMGIRNGVLPRLRAVEEKLNHCLAREFDERLLVAFDNPVPQDHAADLQRNTQYLTAGVYTVNEVRSNLGLPPVSWGSKPYTGQPEQQPQPKVSKCGGEGGKPGVCPEGGSDTSKPRKLVGKLLSGMKATAGHVKAAGRAIKVAKEVALEKLHALSSIIIKADVIPIASDVAREALLKGAGASNPLQGVPLQDLAVISTKALAWAWSKVKAKLGKAYDGTDREQVIDAVLEVVALLRKMQGADYPLPSREDIAQRLDKGGSEGKGFFKCQSPKHPGPCAEGGGSNPTGSKPTASKPEAKPSSPHHETAKKAVVDALKAATHIPMEQRQAYAKAAHTAIGKMSTKAAEHFSRNVKGYSFHADTQGVGNEIAGYVGKDTADKIRAGKLRIGGGFVRSTGNLVLDGASTIDGKDVPSVGIYAHEFGHGIDGTGHTFSNKPEWEQAWKEELTDGRISKYAGSHPAEGFAEFSRLVHATKLTTEQLAQHFPKTVAFWKKEGLL